MSAGRRTDPTPPPLNQQRAAPTPPPLNQQRASQTPPPSNQRRRSLSRGRSRARHSGGEVVVQREVIREVGVGGGSSGAGLVFPMLKRGDYTNWAMVMEVNMQAASLWDAIKDVAISRREDKQALAALLRSTPPEMHPMLIGKGSAKLRGRPSAFSTRAPIACATLACDGSEPSSRRSCSSPVSGSRTSACTSPPW
ncbi:hypothetical protein QYE76_037755 [Lolium multiflorum]|uniref:DUF4219 domain-containing protein n=1 Tax=Lolium multiflorum TaxID=4521 RepID=A0AAD8V035_LOLMU|nr:hypothetical protein QYE76_037755 [Lolium multiflorum]